jgi:hypothetical protein
MKPNNESSTVANVERQDNDLLITFVNGKTYCYTHAASEFDNIVNADSAGKYLNSMIKPNYAATLVA